MLLTWIQPSASLVPRPNREAASSESLPRAATLRVAVRRLVTWPVPASTRLAVRLRLADALFGFETSTRVKKLPTPLAGVCAQWFAKLSTGSA